MADTTGTDWAQIKSGTRHGTQAYGQASDGTGTSGNFPKFNADGSLTDSGIAASGGGGGTEFSETPSGTMNGTNKTFTLSHTPNPALSLNLQLNGVGQVLSVDFTLSTATITYTVAPKSSDYMTAFYTY